MNASETSWTRVVSDFRRVCLARREEQADEADRLLREDLPRSIAEWSRESGTDGAAKRATLDQMFQVEQRRVDDAWILHHLLVLRFTDQILPALAARVTESVRAALVPEFPLPAASSLGSAGERTTGHTVRLAAPRRVAFDDVPAVIDLLLRQEQAGRPAVLQASRQ